MGQLEPADDELGRQQAGNGGQRYVARHARVPQAVEHIELARLAGKVIGIGLFAPLSGITQKKALLLGIGMVPMSAIAVVMVQGASALYPEFGAKLSSIVLSAVVILELVGPLATQWALRRAGETEPVAGAAA